MPTAFVSFFFQLDEDRSSDRSIYTSMNLFQNFVGSDLRLIVFIDHRLYEIFNNIVSSDKNIGVVSFNFADSNTRKITEKFDNLSLPNHRTEKHDTQKFMEIMNAKTEFVKRGIELFDDPSISSYAWIDFNIFHVINDKTACIETLKKIGNSDIKDEHGIVIPGCWPPGYGMDIITDAVNWRFCGGFFVGSKKSIVDFAEKNFEAYEYFLGKVNKIVWEVNTWHYLEYMHKVKFSWFEADHNDSIVKVPSRYLNE